MQVVRQALLLLVLTLCASQTFADERQLIELPVQGAIDIDSTGRVVSYRLATRASDGVREVIDSQIRTWRFEPIIADGAAVPATMSMHFVIRAEVVAEDRYQLHFGKVSFGGPKLIEKTRSGEGQLRYPLEMAAIRAGGLVLLAVRLDADGRPIDVHPYQISLDREFRSDRKTQRLRGSLEQAALRAVVHWRYRMVESVNGEAVPMSVIVPIDFVASQYSGSKLKRSGWRVLVPGPISRAPRQQPSFAEVDSSSLSDSLALSLDSRFRLISGEE